MVKSVEGVYRDGKVELLEPPPAGPEGRVIVTFLAAQSNKLADLGISTEEAAEIRARFLAVEEDWMRPEMDVYDDV